MTKELIERKLEILLLRYEIELLESNSENPLINHRPLYRLVTIEENEPDKFDFSIENLPISRDAMFDFYQKIQKFLVINIGLEWIMEENYFTSSH